VLARRGWSQAGASPQYFYKNKNDKRRKYTKYIKNKFLIRGSQNHRAIRKSILKRLKEMSARKILATFPWKIS
jgi:hypothetical protein